MPINDHELPRTDRNGTSGRVILDDEPARPGACLLDTRLRDELQNYVLPDSASRRRSSPPCLSIYELELLSDSVPVRDEFRRTRLDTKLDAIGYADARRRTPGREEDFECGGVQGLVR